MHRFLCVTLLMTLAVVFNFGCATKKYVRNRVAERVNPLENRTGELEETSRRNTQQLGELRTGVEDARNRADKAQATANSATSSAEQANTRVSGVEHNVEDLRANLDKYTMQATSMVFFLTGSAVLTKQAMAQLDQFTSQLTGRRGFVLEIVGYGDSDNPTTYNQSLAQLRAEAVQRYLADRNNIPIMRMFAVGMGSSGFEPTSPRLQRGAITRSASQAIRAQGWRGGCAQTKMVRPTGIEPVSVRRGAARLRHDGAARLCH